MKMPTTKVGRALTVPCPYCYSPPGQGCDKPYMVPAARPHAGRIRAGELRWAASLKRAAKRAAQHAVKDGATQTETST